MAAFRTFWNSPVGPKTTHFWGPIANFSFVVAGLADTQKPPDMISGNMTGVMCIYSVLIMRFAWVVQPRNYLLMACHASNETVQLYQLSRWSSAHGSLQVGDVIILWDRKSEKPGKHNKFDSLWLGLYIIRDIVGPNSFHLSRLDGEPLDLPTNGQMLKLFFKDDI